MDAQAPRLRASLTTVVGNRRFLAFAAVHSSYLLAYNMLYLALPVELQRVGLPAATITWFFMLAAVVVMLVQLPVTRLVAGWDAVTRLRAGHLLLAVCFLPIALAAPMPPAPGAWRHVPMVVMVVLLHLGQVLVMPAGREVVAGLAGERLLGTHLGALSSFGGLAVLLGSLVLGGLLDLARTPQPSAWLPWLAMALPPLVSALTVGLLVPRALGERAPGATVS